jgi:hypothetical protein
MHIFATTSVLFWTWTIYSWIGPKNCHWKHKRRVWGGKQQRKKKVATTKKVEDGGEMNERRFPNNIFFPIDTKNCAEGRLESGQRKKMLRVKFCFGRESKIKLQPMINLCWKLSLWRLTCFALFLIISNKKIHNFFKAFLFKICSEIQ